MDSYDICAYLQLTCPSFCLSVCPLIHIYTYILLPVIDFRVRPHLSEHQLSRTPRTWSKCGSRDVINVALLEVGGCRHLTNPRLAVQEFLWP
jgi:hypothetical protein